MLIVEAVRRLKNQTSENHDGDGDGGGGVVSYPDRPGEPDCAFFIRTGTCGYGVNCRFNHPSDLVEAKEKVSQYRGLFRYLSDEMK